MNRSLEWKILNLYYFQKFLFKKFNFKKYLILIKMIIDKKNLNKKIISARSFFNNHGYLIIRNSFKKTL